MPPSHLPPAGGGGRGDFKQTGRPYTHRPRMDPKVTWLPHLLTTTTLLAGFHALLATFHGDVISAAWLVLLAMVCDGLDGRLARWFGSTSAFGAHYDSLADCLSFGIVPAFIVYQATLDKMHTWGVGWGWIGHLTVCSYLVSTVIRLAHFLSATQEARYFRGLPSVAAAALIVGWVWIGEQEGWRGDNWIIGAWLMTLIASILMISPLRYPSFKQIGLPASSGIGLCLLLLLVLHPPLVLFTGFALYSAVGIVNRFAGHFS